MHVLIAKVDEVLFEGEAKSLTVPAVDGEMTVLGEHMPLVATLKAGTVVVRLADEPEPRRFVIEGGLLEARRDGATVVL